MKFCERKSRNFSECGRKSKPYDWLRSFFLSQMTATVPSILRRKSEKKGHRTSRGAAFAIG